MTQAIAANSIEVSRSAEAPTYNVFGVLLQFLVPPTAGSDEINVMAGTIGPGVVVPLHSHVDPEIFYLLEGSLEVYRSGDGFEGWAQANAGDTLLIPGEVRHALRNSSPDAVKAITISRGTLYDFFRTLGVPVSKSQPSTPPAPPTPEQLQQLFALAERYGYRMGSPEENAAIGISLPG